MNLQSIEVHVRRVGQDRAPFSDREASALAGMATSQGARLRTQSSGELHQRVCCDLHAGIER